MAVAQDSSLIAIKVGVKDSATPCSFQKNFLLFDHNSPPLEGPTQPTLKEWSLEVPYSCFNIGEDM